ncbi:MULTISPECIES: LON peptidase substrate-binding domain-containing protein [Zobellia]|uniref:LON peptidase substrate-binding domain-containing protein n=1 Tax=Zobellia TaxID=112040 RepID=UPI001BFF73BA|nr:MULTISPECIES: LON peptidase substrate-binding domain-containing protein [Zobellia]MBT9190038.1 LON peptidase substrate-binding domain-containing protein [Zobellia russellii]MBU2973877.1 LON peptidase substrate-binding domain-containing protein [Zobellia sp. B3R18]MDO6821125.1 LON peptidase substrate-binding domain-containing protein [Zobellia sp. 1_MG-2023]
MKLALLPLQSIFFPGETVPLHIFEDRYKQLIKDCRNEAVTFGIPVYINDSMTYGTEVQLVEIVNTYEDGAMDVTCVARQVFRILSFKNQMDGKLYAGGTIKFIDSVRDADKSLKKEVLDKIHELYELMAVPYTPLPLEKFNSYVLVHKMGLSFDQEYQLLQMPSERDRLLFMKSHLISTISMLSEVNRTKKTIEMNGNFKNFDPLDFKDFNL